MSVFSDWGGTAWAEDLDTAKAQALAWLSSVASSKSWPSAATAYVTAAIEQSYDAADGWFSDDVPAFWSLVPSVMDAYTGSKPTNWDKLRDAYRAGSGAATTTAAAREEGSVATVAAGTLEKSIEDVQEIAAATKSYGPLVLGALAVVAVVAYAASKGRG